MVKQAREEKASPQEREALGRVVKLAESQSALARELDIQPQFLWEILNKGTRQLPPKKAALCERLTGGEVTCEELRPDVAWRRVKDRAWKWHKEGRPLVDVTVEEEAA